MIRILILLLLVFANIGNAQVPEKSEIENIPLLILQAKNESINLDLSNNLLAEAYKITNKVEQDSLKTAYLIQIAYRYFKNNNDVNFRKLNREARILSQRSRDTLQFAETYWDLGMLHLTRNVNDSAYFAFNEARKNYAAKNDNFFVGRMLLNMAIAQSNVKDFTGSEITTTEALEILKPLKKNRQIYGCYNNLAIIYNGLNDFEQSLFYHNEALKYTSGIKNGKQRRVGTLNNIGIVYENQKKYKEAVSILNKAWNIQKIEDINSKQYALLLDNLAYNKFKLDNNVLVEDDFLRAHKIRDSIKDYAGLSRSKLHLAEYYLFKKDTVKSTTFLNAVVNLYRKTKRNAELQEALLMLSDIDKKNSTEHYLSLIKLNDSLNLAERQIRNKFTLIRFETNEQINLNTQLEKKNKLQMWAAAIIFLLTSLLLIIRNQRTRVRNLQLEQEQQASNEEIYSIMLNQQEQIEESKNEEKRRISEELHDGVLGKLFGTRLLLDTLNDSTDPESVLQREQHIQELQQIEEEVRNVSHELHEKSQAFNVSYVQLVEKLLQEQSQIGNFKYDLSIADNIHWASIDNTLKMNIYRILQESMQNINKYAQAKNVEVIFKLNGQRLKGEIIDDGIGFKADKKIKGIGHKNIAARIRKLNGTLEITSSPNNGAKISIDVPV